jgi:hypothetical protein
MEPVVKRRNTISVFEKDIRILEIINKLGPCSPPQVKDQLADNPELLLVMRAMHNLVDRGFLTRVVINNVRLYKVKPNYKGLRPYLRVDV